MNLHRETQRVHRGHRGLYTGYFLKHKEDDISQIFISKKNVGLYKRNNSFKNKIADL